MSSTSACALSPRRPSTATALPRGPGILFADPLLGTLDDNGWPTATMALGAGSPAIGLGNDCPAADQRGEARSSPCDSGAYEAP